MNISNIAFSGIYKIKCKSVEQAQKIKATLPDSLDFNQEGKDIVIMPSPYNDKSDEVLNTLKENTDAHDKPMRNTAINAYKRNSEMGLGQIVDTYR